MFILAVIKEDYSLKVLLFYNAIIKNYFLCNYDINTTDLYFATTDFILHNIL